MLVTRQVIRLPVLIPSQERQLLMENPVYRKYAEKTYSSLTRAGILADLDSITKVSYETLPLIEFLLRLYNAKTEEDKISQIDLLEEYSLLNRWLNRIKYGTQALDSGFKNERFDVEVTDYVLSSGSLANAEMKAAVAGDKLQAAWVIWSWDTAPGTAYTFAYHEEDGSADQWHRLLPGDQGKKQWLYYLTSTASKGLHVDIGGGSGSEKLRSIVSICNWD